MLAIKHQHRLELITTSAAVAASKLVFISYYPSVLIRQNLDPKNLDVKK